MQALPSLHNFTNLTRVSHGAGAQTQVAKTPQWPVMLIELEDVTWVGANAKRGALCAREANERLLTTLLRVIHFHYCWGRRFDNRQ
jgi:hypothetical protein